MTDLQIAMDTSDRPRMRKQERREQILLELKLRPHVRIAELAERFGVSGETIRRDFEELSSGGLLNRAHGGASAPAHGQYPTFDERKRARVAERERIGRRAAALVRPGETVMIDSGSTTLQLARFLAYEGTPCTVITNSLPVAMTLGGGEVQVILCPGDYLAPESAVVGTDAVEYLDRHGVDRCLIGASALSETGPSESVRGFAAIKRAMLRQASQSHLLIDSEKFGKRGLAHVGRLGEFTSIVVDAMPTDSLGMRLSEAGVEVILAD
ncbi:DeoR/GlpR family DNA-binding transcription regulator [Sulfitobacter sp. LCG007]